MGDPALESGSFRDRSARVFYHNGQVFRGLTERALAEWQALASTKFYRDAVAAGTIIPTEQADASSLPLADRSAWSAILRHETVPFVSYPYEWPFGMLKDAALLQLDLLLSALEEGLTLKDASPYNVQWRGAAPVFIDVASFEKWRAGEPWFGYRQFCQMFLYPLLLMAYRGVPFQAWLRGSLEGIDAVTCNNLLTTRDYLRPGVLAHVYLQARAQRAYEDTARNIRADLRAAGFSREIIKANAARLRRLVAGLSWSRERSEWSEYVDCGHYTADDAARKREFVRDVMSRRDWNLAWDLGCNTGTFSRIAAERARTVVAFDADHLAVERLYGQLKAEGQRSILPLVGNLTDPSPDLGWRNLERKRLDARGRPDIVLCLALIHHLVIGGNVPMPDVLDWLRGLGAEVIIEFVTREDPKVAVLLRNREDQYSDYDLQRFEAGLASRFTIERREPLRSRSRILYYARPA